MNVFNKAVSGQVVLLYETSTFNYHFSFYDNLQCVYRIFYRVTLTKNVSIQNLDPFNQFNFFLQKSCCIIAEICVAW